MGSQSFFDRVDAELRKAADRVSGAMRTLFPPEFSTHLANSCRELGLAVRVVADAALERTEAEIRGARERMRPKAQPAGPPPDAGAPPAG